MIVILIIAIVIFGLFFTGKSGVEAAEQAAVEDEPIRRAIWQGQTGCMGLLFAVIGAMGVFMILGFMLPGQ